MHKKVLHSLPDYRKELCRGFQPGSNAIFGSNRPTFFERPRLFIIIFAERDERLHPLVSAAVVFVRYVMIGVGRSIRILTSIDWYDRSCVD